MKKADDGTTWVKTGPGRSILVLDDGEKPERRVNVPGTGYPYWSDAMGCNPDNRAEQEAVLKQAGVPTEVNDQGQIRVNDRMHRRKLLKTLGMHDRNSFNGD